ncbi:MAG: hypothetical protein GWP38_10105 [Planctomycetia bacterium]|nr:hypothetical protein [Planctomycetia bacterium]
MGFWPNPNENTHHRSAEFRAAYRQVQSSLLSIFHLRSMDWDILLLPLSGSLAIESVIRTFGGSVRVCTEGGFSHRVAEVHHSEDSDLAFGVLHETNDSRFCNVSGCHIVDAVSALPYFQFPESAQVVVTVSSKQFGGDTVWSMAFVRKDFWHRVQPLQGYLDLNRYRKFEQIAETPCTPPIRGLFSLADKLEGFDVQQFRDRIDRRYAEAKDLVLSAGGEVTGGPPAFTFRFAESDCVDTEKLWIPPNSEGWLQAFLWSGTDREFDNFMEELQRLTVSVD